MMFKTKEKILNLTDALNRQSILLSEKDSELKIMQQKLSYNEGMVQTLKDMIEMLKGQLTQESERVKALQGTVLSQLTVSSDKFEERIANLYAEDKEFVESIRSEFKEEGDL